MKADFLKKKKTESDTENVDLDLNKLNLQNTLILGDRKKHFLNFAKYFEENDFLIFKREKLNLSVYDIREIIKNANLTSERKKVFLLSSFYWGGEVQNAMLKILEESPENTFFFLFANSKKDFLNTIISRLQIKNLSKFEDFKTLSVEILITPPNKRFENLKLKKIMDKKVSDYNFEIDKETEKKDRETHILLLESLIQEILDNKLEKIKNKFYDKSFLEKINLISMYMHNEGANPTLFLEWLLLSAPKFD